MNTDKLLEMLLDAIDYSFLQNDGSYDKTLTYPVIDKIQYIKEQLKIWKLKEAELEEASKNYALNNTPWDDCKDEIQESFKAGAKWQKKKTLKESEDAIQYVKENHSLSEVSDFQNAMNISVMKAFDAGKEKMREQMMAKAFDAEILENYDGKVIEYDETILDKKLSNCKVFDKVKVIVVKEEKL